MQIKALKRLRAVLLDMKDDKAVTVHDEYEEAIIEMLRLLDEEEAYRRKVEMTRNGKVIR